MKLELDLNKLESISYKLTDDITLKIEKKGDLLLIETKDEISYQLLKKVFEKPKEKSEKSLPWQDEGYREKYFKNILRKSDEKAKELNKEKIEKIGEIKTSDTKTVYIKEKNNI